jgi:hypothetical protein
MRIALCALLLSAVIVLGAAASSSAAGLRLFSKHSVFNERLPRVVALAPDSAALVRSFVHQVRTHSGHVVINTTRWSAPVYVVGPEQPPVAMLGVSSICPRPGGVFSGFRELIQAVPIPAGALPAQGSDKEAIVWQPSSGHLWELWRVLSEAGRWTACWGGEIENAYVSDGVFPAPFGAGASGLSLLGGQIHIEDLEHRAIYHALEVLLPDTASSGFVWPADRSDGVSDAPDAIPEGTRFRFSPRLDVARLHITPAAREIVMAIQRYGMIVGDTGGEVALSAQDPSPLIAEGRPNPYSWLLGGDPYDALDGVPWRLLAAVSPQHPSGRF